MKNKCPNCGAPIDAAENKCPYCDTKFDSDKKDVKVVDGNKSSNIDENMDGCLRAIVTLGLISLFTGGHRGPRPPRFPRH